MTSLPDGTTVSSQQTQNWNVNPPSFNTVQGVQNWNFEPPPVAGLTLTSDEPTISPGGTITASGSVSKNGDPASGDTVKLTVTGPSTLDPSDPETDSQGDYSQTVGPFEDIGEYSVTAEVDGIQSIAAQNWNK